MEVNVALSLPRDVASVPVTRQVLDSCLERLGVMPETRADIALALSEACANVIRHAGPGEEYEVIATTRDGRCVIEVVDHGGRDELKLSPGDQDAVIAGHGASEHGPPEQGLPEHGTSEHGLLEPGMPEHGPPEHGLLEPGMPEHGRGLKIIDAVTDELSLTGSGPAGTTVHFEKVLNWIPGALAEQLSAASR